VVRAGGLAGMVFGQAVTVVSNIMLLVKGGRLGRPPNRRT